MAHRKLRVLLDLSMASRGYCGIAQDVRLLYKTLVLCPEIEVTGLIGRAHKLGPLHKFLPPTAPRGDRLANQAEFLWGLAHGHAGHDIKLLRALGSVQHLFSTIRARRADTDPLELDRFWPVIWRVLFSPTLSSADIPLVRNGRFLLANHLPGSLYARAMFKRRAIKLDTRGYDFLIVQGPRPFRTSPETRSIVRYHDLIPVLHPDTRPSPMDIKWHHMAIRRSPPDAVFACNSEPTRDDLVSVYPGFQERSETIPYALSDVYRPEVNPEMLRSIVDVRRSSACGAAPPEGPAGPFRYILCVSTLEPRKNFVGLIQAFSALRARCASQPRIRDLKLVIVGSPGWEYEPTLAAMRGFVARGDLIHLEHVPADELRVLYTHAVAFVFPSHAEGFGFPPLEAMACDAPVIASDVAAHRWVLGDAALYCDPNDPASIATAAERLVACDESGTLRARLVALGRERVKRYSFPACASQWLEFLRRLKDGNGSVSVAPGNPRHITMDRAA